MIDLFFPEAHVGFQALQKTRQLPFKQYTLVVNNHFFVTRYGDKTPKTVLGRSIAIFWTMWGQIMVVMLVAQVTSKLSTGIIGEEIRVYGKKVIIIQFLKK